VTKTAQWEIPKMMSQESQGNGQGEPKRRRIISTTVYGVWNNKALELVDKKQPESRVDPRR